MAASRLRTVALLAGRADLHVLRRVLLPRRELQVAAVFTHLRRGGESGMGLSPETGAIRELCRTTETPLLFADGEEARDLLPLLPFGDLDLLIRMSWRHEVDGPALARFRLGRIELRPPTAAGSEADLADIYAGLAERAIDEVLAREAAA
jgi:hypothetical protein